MKKHQQQNLKKQIKNLLKNRKKKKLNNLSKMLKNHLKSKKNLNNLIRNQTSKIRRNRPSKNQKQGLHHQEFKKINKKKRNESFYDF